MSLLALVAAAGLGFTTANASNAAQPVFGDHGAYLRAMTCASTDAVLAGMLEGGVPTQSDLADAALFRARAKDWLARAVAASPRGQDAAMAEFDRESQRLGQNVFSAKDAESAQTLLDTRLLGCDEPAAAPADGAPAASLPGSAAA